MQIANTQITFY